MMEKDFMREHPILSNKAINEFIMDGDQIPPHLSLVVQEKLAKIGIVYVDTRIADEYAIRSVIVRYVPIVE
jgi:hypothetical protein